MDVRVDATRREDPSFPRDDLCRGAYFHAGSHAVHDAGISSLADGSNPSVADCNIGLVDSGVIEDQRVGDHQVGSAPGPCRFGRLAHAVADDFAATEFHFITIDRPIGLNFDDEIRVCEAYAISRGWAVMIGIAVAIDFHLMSFPFTRPLMPKTVRVPPSATNSISFVSPGSNRTAVPAGIFSRVP